VFYQLNEEHSLEESKYDREDNLLATGTTMMLSRERTIMLNNRLLSNDNEMQTSVNKTKNMFSQEDLKYTNNIDKKDNEDGFVKDSNDVKRKKLGNRVYINTDHSSGAVP
jgi:hypothetical protein